MANLMFTPCVTVGDLVFVSGQRGVVDGKIVEGGIKAQLKQALANISKLLAGEGISDREIVKVTLYLCDLDANFALMNEAYLEVMPKPLPARTSVGAATLPGGAIVAVDVIARKVPLSR